MAQDPKRMEDRIKAFVGNDLTANGVRYTFSAKSPNFGNHEVCGIELTPATPEDAAANAALDAVDQANSILEEIKKFPLVSMFANLTFREDLSTSGTKFFQNK